MSNGVGATARPYRAILFQALLGAQVIGLLCLAYPCQSNCIGANTSGGQRQRLAIVRAIVTDPPVLILDQSTAGLDPVSEAQVLDRLLAHRQGKTIILISHRPRVINRADWIVLLEQGRLLLQGSLEDLRSKPGDHLNFLTP